MRVLALVISILTAMGLTPAHAALLKAAKREPYIPAPRSLRVVNGTAPGLPADALSGAQAIPDQGTIYISKGSDNFARAHEVGHVFDAQVLSDGDRTYFQKLLHAPAGAWRTGTGQQGGYRSPSEWFADYYGAAATGMTGSKIQRDSMHGQVIASYAPIGPKRLDRFIAALDRLGRRQGLDPYQPPSA